MGAWSGHLWSWSWPVYISGHDECLCSKRCTSFQFPGWSWSIESSHPVFYWKWRPYQRVLCSFPTDGVCAVCLQDHVFIVFWSVCYMDSAFDNEPSATTQDRVLSWIGTLVYFCERNKQRIVVLMVCLVGFRAFTFPHLFLRKAGKGCLAAGAICSRQTGNWEP